MLHENRKLYLRTREQVQKVRKKGTGVDDSADHLRVPEVTVYTPRRANMLRIDL